MVEIKNLKVGKENKYLLNFSLKSYALITCSVKFKMNRIYIFFFRPQADASTAFLRAARAGQIEKIINLLEQGVDINVSNAVSIKDYNKFGLIIITF